MKTNHLNLWAWALAVSISIVMCACEEGDGGACEDICDLSMSCNPDNWKSRSACIEHCEGPLKEADPEELDCLTENCTVFDENECDLWNECASDCD